MIRLTMFFFSSRRRHTRCGRDWSSTCALPIYDEVVTAGVRAAARLLALPAVKADDLRDRLAAILADANAPQETRAAALDALLALNEARLNNALGAAVRDAGLEGSELLRRVEKLMSERKLQFAIR